MDAAGEQLHPNWRALATVHIPLKRFIKEGTAQSQRRIDNLREKSKISGLKGDEIKEFYQELLTREEEQQKLLIKGGDTKVPNKCIIQKQPVKREFESKKYFQFAMENKLDELKKMNLDGQNINVCDHYGWSALMMASCEGAYEAVEFLLKIGVDRFMKEKTGKTAKDLALKKGHYKIAQLLMESGLTPKACIEEQNIVRIEPFYCEICKQNFKETSKNQHFTSTLHQFNIKSNLPNNKLQKFNISTRNRGLQLMVKQGWDRESGLGPSQSGRLYPVKTVIRKQRTGLGIEQEVARVTHFEPYDRKAVQSHKSDYYKKKARNRNDFRREKVREWKRDRRLRNELN